LLAKKKIVEKQRQGGTLSKKMATDYKEGDRVFYFEGVYDNGKPVVLTGTIRGLASAIHGPSITTSAGALIQWIIEWDPYWRQLYKMPFSCGVIWDHCLTRL
jgi:hypothetical protein